MQRAPWSRLTLLVLVGSLVFFGGTLKNLWGLSEKVDWGPFHPYPGAQILCRTHVVSPTTQEVLFDFEQVVFFTSDPMEKVLTYYREQNDHVTEWATRKNAYAVSSDLPGNVLISVHLAKKVMRREMHCAAKIPPRAKTILFLTNRGPAAIR